MLEIEELYNKVTKEENIVVRNKRGFSSQRLESKENRVSRMEQGQQTKKKRTKFLQTCSYCSSTGASRQCEKCHFVYYCLEEHKSKQWEVHLKRCAEVQVLKRFVDV